ncbi:MAG: hypothetical protein RL570_529 [Actinomycetota bacterium]
MAEFKDVADQVRDIAEVPAVEVITTTAVHLMSAAAIQCGLGEDGAKGDLDEARKLITALAGLVTAAAADIGDHHARPLRDGLRSLQLAFREASAIKDAPGAGALVKNSPARLTNFYFPPASLPKPSNPLS